MPFFRACLVVIALGAPSLAMAELPVFTARCPLGNDVEADADGRVLVNGATAQVKALNAQAYEARSGDFTFSITHDGGGRGLQVSYTGPNRAHGICTVREVSEGAGADDGGGAMAGAPSATSRERVRFAAGATGAVMSATNLPGQSVRYVLGAKKGQTLVVAFDTDSEDLTYRIANPDGSSLLDEIGTFQPYRGQLWQSGDHVVEVINRSAARNAAFDARFAIE
jgi:hypothetical protein